MFTKTIFAVDQIPRSVDLCKDQPPALLYTTVVVVFGVGGGVVKPLTRLF